MRVGIPKDLHTGQVLVSGTPDTAAKLIKMGFDVVVESQAGEGSHFPDAQYFEAGAQIASTEEVWGSDIVVCLDTPPIDQLSLMKPHAILIARLDPRSDDFDIRAFSERGITALAIDAVPRTSRAQALDVRSSMMNVGGYRAVIEAAHAFGRTFAGQVTAAGKVSPASVYVIGAGVAGLAAIGQAGSMGAVVSATDVRPEAAGQVESLGARFVEIPVKQKSADGYAQALDEDQQRITREIYAKQAALSDIVITTAQVPGRPAPLLLDEAAVAGMKPGSVIVDMGASPLGGNCSLTQLDSVVVTEGGVTIVGYSNLPARMPAQSSSLFGQNIVNLFKLIAPGKDGRIVLDEEDEIVRSITVTLDGQIMWPPPPVDVSVSNQQPKACETSDGQHEDATQQRKRSGLWWKIALVALAALLVMVTPAGVASHYVVFALAVVVGFYVITNVTHNLHTPLMSETNAISGIIIVGAMLQIGSDIFIVRVLSFVALAIAAINIFGGFYVTHRMLKMFERSSEK